MAPNCPGVQHRDNAHPPAGMIKTNTLQDLGLVGDSSRSANVVAQLSHVSGQVSRSLRELQQLDSHTHVTYSSDDFRGGDSGHFGAISHNEFNLDVVITPQDLDGQNIAALDNSVAHKQFEGIRDQQTVRLLTETSAAFSSSGRSKISDWDSSAHMHQTSPYHRHSERFLAYGRSSPAPSVTSQLSGPVTPLLPEVQQPN